MKKRSVLDSVLSLFVSAYFLDEFFFLTGFDLEKLCELGHKKNGTDQPYAFLFRSLIRLWIVYFVCLCFMSKFVFDVLVVEFSKIKYQFSASYKENQFISDCKQGWYQEKCSPIQRNKTCAF